MTLTNAIILGLTGLCAVLYILYQRAQRKKASVEYSLKHAALKRDYEDHVKVMKELGIQYEESLEEYIAVRKRADVFIKALLGTGPGLSDESGGSDPSRDN